MTKREFEQAVRSICGKTVSITKEQFGYIHTVYMWHPRIPDDCDVEAIASIYIAGGMPAILEMLPEANRTRSFCIKNLRLKGELRPHQFSTTSI